MEKYTIGIDYGTQSGRVVLVSLKDGRELVDHVTEYKHGVMDDTLPIDRISLGNEWALQHPQDYLDVIEQSVPAVLKAAEVDPADIIGVGIDFTACTMLPIDEKGEPLCFNEKWSKNPHSWIKLWKHHAAQPHANELNSLAKEREETFLARYGGKLSSEWMLAKAYQILDEAPDVYQAADRFVEATDWVTMKLSDNLVRNSCTAGYKSAWHKTEGYPSEEFFKEIDPRLKDLTSTKLRGEVVPLGTKAGRITREVAEKTGLKEGIAVAVGNVDAHAAVPAVGVVDEGKLVMAMGTSICHMLLGKKEVHVEGMAGVVEDGIIPGYYGYEAGQSAVGDIFEWFVNKSVPGHLHQKAEERGVNVHTVLEEEAAKYRPGQTGLLALDWWNGNRSILVDTELSGLLLGYSLKTKPQEVYRALLEATAYGTKMIIDAFTDKGVAVNELYACGGLPQKNDLLMQIYADVTNLPIKVAASKHTPALGAAMFASVAAGTDEGGYESIVDAAAHMGRVRDKVYQPIAEHVDIYKQLYAEYKELHDYFGRGKNDVMKRLLSLR
ncbi:ribulokinase [Paenalkalicoccus suaedae]|uniref:Ribulokinase n=1 Tax=Paenalkalicoccus suaedae TaxID=2592382 RepID=A0A859FI95_9BACI|nr:ribulokinase [Paenalkalicoccus suaedae]QKS72831.1 ribulokinase [Paenalkalicoccus suaedae]